MSHLTVVIAAYNEEGNVEPLTRRLHRALSGMAGWSAEILYVVEGTDRTREILAGLAQEMPGLRVLYQERPSGIGSAFRRGFAAVSAETEWVVTLDADLNHQPEEIPRLLEAARRGGSDVLVGSRFLQGSEVDGTPLWKRFLSGSMNQVMRFLYGLRVADKTSGFRVYRAEVLRSIAFRNDAFAFLPEVLILAHRAGFRIAEEPIHFIYRQEGRSKMEIWPTTVSYLRLLGSRFGPVRKAAAEAEVSRRAA
ncbi:MAG TPA: glycosyltransferase [Thermoanaerobaculia bacterium]|nr:glycosyltransferase [Thermoanaerobaculia bacterium]